MTGCLANLVWQPCTCSVQVQLDMQRALHHGIAGRGRLKVTLVVEPIGEKRRCIRAL